MSAIEIENLEKTYADNTTAVKEISLDMEKGEVFGFLGPNGAGKSTTIDLIMDYIRPTSGKITVLGYDSQANSKEVHKQIGVLPDSYGLYPRLTGRDHIEFAIRTKNANQNIGQIIEKVGLNPEDAERKVGQYSSGMKQRLALGMALVGNPEILILDEPSRGLDPHGMQMVRKIIEEEKQKGVTVFFSSHILSQVEAVSDRIGIIKNGRLLAVDTVEGLRSTAESSSQLTLELAEKPDLKTEDLMEINGVTEIIFDKNFVRASFTDPRAKINVIEKLTETQHRIIDIESSRPSLEDLFTSYTGEVE